MTEIGNGAFRGNRKLRKITIGKNVRKIGKKAFYGDRKLEKIRIKSVKLKKAYKDSLKGIAKKAVINVPNQKVKAYRKMLFLKKSRKTVR